MVEVFIDCAPMGAPRMVDSDRWKKRPVVLRYWAYKNEMRQQLVQQLTAEGLEALSKCKSFKIIFYLPFPKTYSAKKREQLNGALHEEKPDIDNLLKAVFDTICESDKHISSVNTTKLWAADKQGIDICGY